MDEQHWRPQASLALSGHRCIHFKRWGLQWLFHLDKCRKCGLADGAELRVSSEQLFLRCLSFFNMLLALASLD